MARLRKRFYVARRNGGGLEILNLRHLMTALEIQYSHAWIVGPFRTLNAAVDYLETESGVKYGKR